MRYTLHPNGSFDLRFGSIALLRAYPEIDGVPVRPLSVKAATDKIIYTLEDGALCLSFDDSGEELALRCTIEGLNGCHDIMPVGAARVDGCDRVFTQGFGIGGPSGFEKLDSADADSHSLIAVGTDKACLVIYARAQDRLHNLYHIQNQKLRAGFETEGLPFDALPTLYFREGLDFSSSLNICAQAIAVTMHARPVEKQAFHWCSWYYLYHNLDQSTLEAYLEGFDRYRGIAPFSHIQIDAGYFPSCGDWLEATPRFPKGLKGAADTIKAAGYEPGVWIAPFMVGDESKLYREHPDWMLRGLDGKPVVQAKLYNEPKVWGYRDSDYFVLDTSHPDAMAYIKHVFETLRGWGYTLFKTDFMLWGMQDSSKVRRHTPGKTSFEYFRDLLSVIREAIGEDARWLGCIAPFMPMIGYADMMRVAGDVGASWDEKDTFGPINMLRELTADQYFNNVYWQNDPDAVMLRDFHIFIQKEQIEALALLEAMSGGAMYTSDPIHQIGEDRRALLEFIRSDAVHTAQYPEWSDMRDEVCVVQRLKTHALVYFFNAGNAKIVRAVDWKALLGSEPKWLRRRGGNSLPADALKYVEIPPRGGVLFFATDAELAEEPKNMWRLQE